jgi:hypothetical protein
MGNNKGIAHNWSPITHPSSDDLWRVPMNKTNDIHTLYVGDSMTRSFTTTLLPDYVISKITMVNAKTDYATLILDKDVDVFDVYCPSLMNDIGWHVSPSWYCLCFNDPELKTLRGENE